MPSRSTFLKPNRTDRNIFSIIRELDLSLVVIWSVFRLVTSLIAATASSIKPFTVAENNILIWPPSTPISEWLERVFISPWYRWDAAWYTQIITNGYDGDNGTANFHPLYPMLSKLVASFNISPIFSLLIVSSCATIILLFIFKKISSLDLSQEQSNLSVLVLLSFPISFILFAPYPESLFLLLSISCFYYLRKEKWLIAGILAFFAVLTRQQGLFLTIPFAWEIWDNSKKNLHSLKVNWRNWLPIVMIPLGYLVWIWYRLLLIKDSSLVFNNVQSVIYSLFISSSATEVIPVQGFLWPWNSLYLGIQKLFESPDIDIWLNLIISSLFLIFLFFSWRRLRPSYKIYSIVITLVSLSYYTGPIHPYMGLPRHLYLAFPVFIGLTPILSQNRVLKYLYLLSGIILMSILILGYSLMSWVP